jgi:Zn ribbon nucleic-acid-binding protein
MKGTVMKAPQERQTALCPASESAVSIGLWQEEQVNEIMPPQE